MWRYLMLQKFFVCILFAVMLLLAACGDDGGTADGKWVGEVYAHTKSKTSTVVGEFDSYSDCVEVTQKESKSGVFNCGVKTN